MVGVPTLDELQNEVMVTLCLFEKYFPHSFFDIMVHLTVHVVRHVRLCGPIYLRWMYPFERFMKVLKAMYEIVISLKVALLNAILQKKAMSFVHSNYQV